MNHSTGTPDVQDGDTDHMFADLPPALKAHNCMQMAAIRDTTDWMLEPDLQRSYDMRYGPCDVGRMGLTMQVIRASLSTHLLLTCARYTCSSVVARAGESRVGSR